MSTINFELSKKSNSMKKQILVRVSVSRSFRVGGKTKVFVESKDWDENKQTLRRTSKIEKVEKQREIEALRKQLNDLQEHIARAIIETTDFDKITTREERQNWMDYVIASYYDPCVQLSNATHLTFQEFAKV